LGFRFFDDSAGIPYSHGSFLELSLHMRLVVILVFIILVIASWYIFDWNKYISDPALVREFIKSNLIWAPLVFIVIQTLAESLLVPGTPFTIAGGLLFGTWLGALCSIIASVLSAMILFWFTRFVGESYIREFLRNKFPSVSRYNDRLKDNGFKHMLVLRLLPFTPANLMNLAFPLTNVRKKDYFWSTFLGNLPGTIFLSLVGSFFYAKDPPYFLATLGFFIIASFVLFFYRGRNKKEIV